MKRSTARKNPVVARNLKKLQGRLTLRQFADKIGVGQSTLHNYLQGRDPKATFIARVCKKTGCDSNWLLGITTGKNIKSIDVSIPATKDVLNKIIRVANSGLELIGGDK